jgi:hypothetical protein
MKILFLDLFQTSYHDNLNKNFIKCLNEEHKVSLLCRKSLYTYDSIGYNSWRFPVILNNSRLKSLYFIFRYFMIKNKDFDIIFIPTFETITFVLFSFFCNKKIYIVHHLNIDELKSPTKRAIFNLYKNKINHLVFDNSFKTILQEKYNVKSMINQIVHPGTKFSLKTLNKASNHKKLCVALSQSNDDEIILKLIDYNERNNFLIKNNIELIIRSNVLTYNKNNFIVYNSNLPDSEYNELISNSYLTVLLHPKNFKYRFSGVLLDSLFNKKVVVSNDFHMARLFNKKYPNVCKVAKTSEEFFTTIQSFNNSNNIEEEFKVINEEFSFNQFKRNLLKIINAS